MKIIDRINNPSVAAFVLGGFIALSWYAYHHAPRQQTPLYDPKKPPAVEMHAHGDRLSDARDAEQRLADQAFYARINVEADEHDGVPVAPDFLSVLARRHK